MHRVLVYGGRGALGAACLEHFKTNKWWTCNVDLLAHEGADVNVVVSPSDSWTAQAAAVSEKVAAAVGDQKFDAILCVAGGWAGGNASSAEFIPNADLMWKQSVWSSAIAAQLASKHLKEDGLLQLTGAQPCLGGTPGMMGYGMAKAAVHQLVASLSKKSSGLPSKSTVLAVLPMTLDTPMNRQGMPKADHSSWTTLEYVASTLYGWAEKSDGRPSSGSLVKLVTKAGETELVLN